MSVICYWSYPLVINNWYVNTRKPLQYLCYAHYNGIGITKRVEPIVPYETLQNLYNSLVLPYFDYCSPLWDNCGSLQKEKKQKFQHRAARVMIGANYVKSSRLLRAMSWKNLNDWRKLNKLVLIYKIVNNHSAPGLKDKLL